MAKTTGLGDRFLIDGYDLSGDVTAIDEISGGPATLDVTRIGKLARERVGGLYDASIQWTTWFNPASSHAHATLSTLPITSRIVTYLRGAGLGNVGAGLVGKQFNYAPTRGDDGSLTVQASARSSAAVPLEWGLQITRGLRTDTSATNGDICDYSAETTAGLSAYLQVLSFSGTSCTITIQHSTDGSTWSDLTAFTAATGIGAERIAVTGNVHRYLRVATSGTFTSAQIVVLARRAGEAVVDPYLGTYATSY